MKTNSVLFLFTCSMLLVLSMCTKPKVEQTEDDILFSFASTTEGYTWYKGSDTKLESTIPGAHHKYVRTRFNNAAQAALDSSGKLPFASEFPSGSLVVKESYDENNNLKVYAVMYKRPYAANTYEGWQWAEYDGNGKVLHSINSDNTGCVNCHSASGNRDLVMFFSKFP